MKANLYNRLKQIRDSQTQAKNDPHQVHSGGQGTVPPKPDPSTVVPTDSHPGTWTNPTQGVWYYSVDILLEGDLTSLARGISLLARRQITPQELFTLGWFDTETTGLSSGAGTFLFLFGLIQVIPRQGGAREIGGMNLRLHQVLVEDFPYEAGFLDMLLQLLQASRTLVSYNGKAYDLPLLNTRLILGGSVPVYPDHIDLLAAVRRLWSRTLPSCSLSTVEREVCGIHRLGDVPGSLIPEFYFEYQVTGGRPDLHPRMASILAHHRNDLVSMVKIAETLGSRIPIPPKPDASDPGESPGLPREDAWTEGLLGALEDLAMDPRGLEMVLAAGWRGAGSDSPEVPLLTRAYYIRKHPWAVLDYQDWVGVLRRLCQREDQEPGQPFRKQLSELVTGKKTRVDTVQGLKRSRALGIRDGIEPSGAQRPPSLHLRWIAEGLRMRGDGTAAFGFFLWDALVWGTWNSCTRVMVHLEHTGGGNDGRKLGICFARIMLRTEVGWTERQVVTMRTRIERLTKKRTDEQTPDNSPSSDR